MTNPRRVRLAEAIRDQVAALLRKGVRDPRVGFASVVKVEVSADLRVAKIYVSVLGDRQAQADTMKGLESATGYIRSELAAALSLRFMPEIRFVYDEGIAHGARVAELLHQIHDLEPGPNEGKDQ